MPVFLLILFTIALSIGAGIVILIVKRARRHEIDRVQTEHVRERCSCQPACIFQRPGCWLAIKSRSLLSVQCALGLSNVKPCSWTEAMLGHEALFIGPPVKGWILVIGSGLPDPGDDVDACFRFIMGLSRRLGQVQFFEASRILHHHAWIKADKGKVVRAYAWAGQTLWHQGAMTSAEKNVGLKTFDYAEVPERGSFGLPDVASVNVDKVPLLAARWSIDPARIDNQSLLSECGISGDLLRRY